MYTRESKLMPFKLTKYEFPFVVDPPDANCVRVLNSLSEQL